MSALPRYRFLLAALAFLIRTYGAFIMLIPALSMKEIMVEFGVSSAAVGNYVGMIMWACAAVVLFSGPIVSKIGAKKCALTGATITAAAVLLTGLTPTNYLVACAIRFLIGLGMVLSTIAFYPITMTWFTTEEYGRVNSVIEASSTVGILCCFTFVPGLFPSGQWREAHVAFGTVGVILAVLWAILGREPRVEIKGEEKYLHLLRTRLPKLFRIKEVALMGVLLYIAIGVEMGMGTWIPSYLKWEWRWPIATAALVVSVNNVANIVSWPLGGTLSDRVGLRRPFLIVGGPMVFLCILTAVTVVGPMTWFWYGLTGVFSAVYGFTSATIPMEHPQMKPELISTAISSMVFWGFLGGAVMPTVCGWFLDVTGSLYMAMVISSALYIPVGIIGLLCRETGWKAATQKE